MNRPYDLIVHGATGYLGSLVVQYLWANSPRTLRWAVAGRSEEKLVALLSSLGQSQPDLKLPHIMVATLSGDDLGRMASQTRLVLNMVGVSSCICRGLMKRADTRYSHFVNMGHLLWQRV